jgi:enoyl-CoA hydratase/carnithine racemase
MSTGQILCTTERGVCTLVLSRPERRNALTRAMYDELVHALTTAADDPSVRVVRIEGTAGMFTSGNDLGDFMNHPPSGTDSPVFRFLRALIDFPRPIVASVRGHAVGIGTTMLLHCDLVYCDETALFQMPFVQLALVPEAASSLLLPRAMGHQRAAELLLLGERIDAHQAANYGFVNRVIDSAHLDEHVTSVCDRLAGLAPEAIRRSKALMRHEDRAALDDCLMREASVFIERLGSPEVAEAIQAFFEKRPADFSKF